MERSHSIHMLNRNPLPVSTDFPLESQPILKRPAEDPATYPYAKQPRFETPVQGYGYAYPQQQQAQPTAGADYYQQAQQPWQS